MKLIDITCPKCKATMEVDEKRKQVTCKYCDNKILIDDEVKKVKHIMVGQIDEEQEFINANTNLNKFTKYYPNNHHMCKEFYCFFQLLHIVMKKINFVQYCCYS